MVAAVEDVAASGVAGVAAFAFGDLDAALAGEALDGLDAVGVALDAAPSSPSGESPSAVRLVPCAIGRAAVPTADAEWRALPVGFLPSRRAIAKHPEWRSLPIAFPFRHPPVRCRWLPRPPPSAAETPSLLVAPIELELPFED